MKKALSMLAASTLLSACSQSTTFTATSTLEGGAPRMTVTLKLNDFTPTNTKGGDGTLIIEKKLDKNVVTPEGTYIVHWQSLGSNGEFVLSVADTGAGLDFQPVPSTGFWPHSASVFWCLACERFLNGAGNLGWLPGVYLKTS